MTFSVLYLIEVLIWKGTFCWKTCLNWSSGTKVMSNWRILRTIENNRNAFLFLAVSHNQCCRLPTDSGRSQHIWLLTRVIDYYQVTVCFSKITWTLTKQDNKNMFALARISNNCLNKSIFELQVLFLYRLCTTLNFLLDQFYRSHNTPNLFPSLSQWVLS